MTQLIFVEDRIEQDDEEKYEMAFENANWDGMDEKDKALGQDLRCYSDYPGNGPERLQYTIERKEDNDLSYPDFTSYRGAIRMNILEPLLKRLPKLRNAVLIDYCSAIAQRLIDGNLRQETHENNPLEWGPQYDEGRDFDWIVYMIGASCGRRVKSVAVGPHLFEKSSTYWRERRQKSIVVSGKRVDMAQLFGRPIVRLSLDAVTWHVHSIRSIEDAYDGSQP